MVLLRLFLWVFLISLVRGNALSTQAGSELPNTNGNTDDNLNGDPKITGSPTSTSLFEREDQTPIVTPDQETIPGQHSTAEPTSPLETATPGKTEPSPSETSSINTQDKDPTSEQHTESMDPATRDPISEQRTESTDPATRDEIIYHKDDKERFHYDYYTLRVQGLICALILFILGILILTCGRCRNASCCRKRKSRRAFDEMTRL